MTHSCQIDVNQVFSSLQNPATQANFLNPGYVEPTDSPWCAFSIRIFYNGTAYEFAHFYEGETLSILSTFGERGEFSFTIHDPYQEFTILPFVPANEQYAEIWNREGTHLYAAGYVRDVDPRMSAVRDDLTEAGAFVISCTDLYHELERRVITDVYISKKIGFILKDVITRYTTLDASGIDATAGFTIDSYPVNAKTPSQVVTHLTDLLGNTTYIIDPATRKFTLADVDSGDARFSTVITDSNLYDYFDKDTFSLRRQTDQIKNEIELHFNRKFTSGTVNVENGSNIVVGYGAPPETDWDDLPADLRFSVAGSDAIYTVNKNNSSGATQELRLSSAYQETTATNQAYELLGYRTRVRVTDEESRGVMSRVRGDDGRFVFVVSEDSNNFTFSEARRFAQALLTLSSPLPKGQGTTYGIQFQELPICAGKVMSFQLPNSKRFSGDIIVQQIRLVDEGNEILAEEHQTGVAQPRFRIEMSFTATLNSRQAQMRKVMMDLRKVKVNFDDGDIQRYAQLRETMIWQDCIHGHRPTAIQDILSIEDTISARQVSGVALYYTELDYVLSPVDYSFTSD